MHIPTSHKQPRTRQTSKIKRVATILAFVSGLVALGLFVAIFVIDLFSDFNGPGGFVAVMLIAIFLVVALWIVLYIRE